MILRTTLALRVLIVLMLCASIGHAKTVTLEPSDNRTDVFLNFGDTLVVELSSGQVAGFRWLSHLPNNSVLSALNESLVPADMSARVPVKTQRFCFNAAIIGESQLVFGFETAAKVPGAAPQDTSAYLVHIHVAAGSPLLGSAVLLGVYKGTLPCADCSGLETVLRLYAKGKYDTTYAFFVRTQIYRGAAHGDVVLTDRGDWTVLRGDATDPDATVYQLNPDDEEHSDSWLVKEQGAALVQLDREQKPLDTKLNVTLRKMN